MTRHFESLGAFAVHLLALQIEVAEALHHGLEKVATKIEKTAKAEIGHYQDAVGAFPAWAELADSTEERKAQMGYPAGAPLLATGEMKDSIGHEVEGLEAVIGSTDDKMVWHEFGTSKMPPRPVMGPAAIHNKANIEKLVGAGLIGGDQIHAALGYDFETKD
jgi:HK97 gp10 family phage protein